MEGHHPASSDSDVEGLYECSNALGNDENHREDDACMFSVVDDDGGTGLGKGEGYVEQKENPKNFFIKVMIPVENRESDYEINADSSVGALKDDLKSTNFFTGIDFSQKRLRLIFQGRVLRDDTQILSSCGIRAGSVIHAVVSDLTGTPGTNDAPSPSGDTGGFVLPPAGVNVGAQVFVNGVNVSNLMHADNVGNPSMEGENDVTINGPRGIGGVANILQALLGGGRNRDPQNGRNVCSHALSVSGRDDRRWICDRCEARHTGISLHCPQCDFDLCVDCYAQDAALARRQNFRDTQTQPNRDSNSKISMVHGVIEMLDLLAWVGATDHSSSS